MPFQTDSTRKQKKKAASPGGQKDWYRLDLSATVSPTLQRKNFSSVYRLSVLLKEPIRPEVLQEAVDIAMKRFPTYKVAIHKGLFWRYLEPNDRTHPEFGEALRAAGNAGVEIRAVDCLVTPESIQADRPVEVRLGEKNE